MKHSNNNKIKDDNHIIKQHNKTLLLYHIVFPVKYRKEIINESIEKDIKNICEKIGIIYEINFIEIGLDLNHIHFLIQGIPNISVAQIVKIIKSITAKEIFKLHPEIKKELWGGNLWTAGYYANTVGEYGNKEVIMNYVKNQGQKEKDYKKIHSGQMSFEF